MEENTLSVLKIAPGQHPQQVEIDNDLKALQQAVGGSIGASYPFEDPVAIVYNDDGKLISSTLPSTSTLRRTLKGMMQQPAEKTGGKHSFLKMV